MLTPKTRPLLALTPAGVPSARRLATSVRAVAKGSKADRPAFKGFGKPPAPPPPAPPPSPPPPPPLPKAEERSPQAAQSLPAAAPRSPPQLAPRLPPRPAPRPPVVASATALPSAISDRILRRVLAFASLPALLGLLSGPVSYMMLHSTSKPAGGVDGGSPVALYSLGTVLFGAAAAGISYGILSASWDTAPGSLLGWEEAGRNVGLLKERLWGKKREL